MVSADSLHVTKRPPSPSSDESTQRHNVDVTVNETVSVPGTSVALSLSPLGLTLPRSAVTHSPTREQVLDALEPTLSFPLVGNDVLESESEEEEKVWIRTVSKLAQFDFLEVSSFRPSCRHHARCEAGQVSVRVGV
jgi:hypothetical protein